MGPRIKIYRVIQVPSEKACLLQADWKFIDILDVPTALLPYFHQKMLDLYSISGGLLRWLRYFVGSPQHVVCGGSECGWSQMLSQASHNGRYHTWTDFVFTYSM